VDPATSDKDGGPVLCADNATTMASDGASATPSATAVSNSDPIVPTSEVSDTGDCSFPGVDASLLPFSDATTRPSFEAPRSQLSPASTPFVPPTANFCDHGVTSHYDRLAHQSTSSVAPLLPDACERLQPSTPLHPPPDDVSSPLPPPQPPPGMCEPIEASDEQTLLKTAIVDELPEHVNLLFLQTVEENTLSLEVTRDLKTLLFDHQHTFAKNSADLGFCDILKHDVDTGDARPIKQSPRKPPLAAAAAEDEILDDMLSARVIEHSNFPWASPVCLVKKKDTTYRFCVDYRRVNAVSKKDAFPIPDINDVLDHLKGAKYFATFYLLSDYWQLGLSEYAKERSAFCTRRGLFHFTRMPISLAGAPSSFCRLMSIVLRDLLWKICLCIFAKTPDKLVVRLRQVLGSRGTQGQAIKVCALSRADQISGAQGLTERCRADGRKIEVIQNLPLSHCVRDVRAFYGLASYYRRFVKGFATIAEPLTKLTRKNVRFEWTDETQEAFDQLKRELRHDYLGFPSPGYALYLGYRRVRYGNRIGFVTGH